MPPGGFRDYQSITESILGFTAYLRSHDFNIGAKEVQEALVASSSGLMADKQSFSFTLKTIFCSSQEDIMRFDDLFESYWQTSTDDNKSGHQFKSQIPTSRQKTRSIVHMGKGDSRDATGTEEDMKDVSGANANETLKKTDFSVLSEMDSVHLEKLALALWKQMGKRLRRKLKASTTRGALDIRRTIRNNISNGGSMLELSFKDKKPEKYRLVILLDVSGSMDKYSFYLLRFILALREHFQHIEAFTFSTRLVRITDMLRIKNLDHVLKYLSQEADHWSSGTKIGGCLHQFNDKFAKRVLNGRTMTLILSDGLDTGEPEALSSELHKIKRRSRRLIWLNPLKGYEGYQPLAMGMKAALPEIDVFASAHSLESILQLEKYLADV